MEQGTSNLQFGNKLFQMKSIKNTIDPHPHTNSEGGRREGERASDRRGSI